MFELDKSRLPIMLVGAAACELQLEDFTSKPGEEEPDLVVVKWADTIQPEPKCVVRSTWSPDDGRSEGLDLVRDALFARDEQHGVPQVGGVEVSGVVTEDAVNCADHVRGWPQPGRGKSRRQCNLAGEVLFFGWRVNRERVLHFRSRA